LAKAAPPISALAQDQGRATATRALLNISCHVSARIPAILQTGAIPRYRPFGGPNLFRAGLRPFFVAAGVWAALSLLLWLAAFTGGLAIPTAFDPLLWHMHEMVFGYGVAAVTGFLLTAIPNWTGRLPLQGAPLMVLLGLWLLGRAAVIASASIGPAPTAVADLAFLAVLLAAVAREIAVGRNWRNLPMIGAVALLLAANALVHAEALGATDTATTGVRLGLATLLMLIALVGGRIVPSFTRNWLAKRGETLHLPAGFGSLDRIALLAALTGLVSWVGALQPIVTAPLLTTAGVLMGVRLSRWQGHRTLADPLLLILHVGQAWLAIGLTLLGLSFVWDAVPSSSAVHALTVGAIGTMTLAVMTRATLGHTGRALAAGPGTVVLFVLVNLAAICRLVAGIAVAGYLPLLMLSGVAWIGAFVLFVLIYGPMLARPRAPD
jgi:uncharacterized protein involved in response to NO